MRVLITGGSGRLGSELQPLLAVTRRDSRPVAVNAPPSAELDVTDLDSFSRAVTAFEPTVIVHAAAYTDVGKAESDKAACWLANVVGTRNAAAVANDFGAKLLHVSTDYVFWGDAGNYAEDDVVGPVRNYYALTKLVAEESARAADDHLIVRTSFRPREWQYPVAFADLYTSQDYVDVIAPEIAKAVLHCRDILFPTLHIATERKSVLELARRRSPHVRAGTRSDSPVPLPADVSLNSGRWSELKRSWGEGG